MMIVRSIIRSEEAEDRCDDETLSKTHDYGDSSRSSAISNMRLRHSPPTAKDNNFKGEVADDFIERKNDCTEYDDADNLPANWV